MKTPKFFLPVLLFFAFIAVSDQLFAQRAEPEKIIVSINLNLDSGENFFLEGDGLELTTPGFNFLRTYKFKVPESIMAEIDFGPFANKIIGVALTTETGEVLIGVGYLNKAGNLSFTIHRNGAGGIFPVGWF